MQVRSIVAVKPIEVRLCAYQIIKWLPVMDEKTPYVIRQIDKCLGTGKPIAYLEEGVIGHNSTTCSELGIFLEDLIELLPPESISIDEMIGEPVKVAYPCGWEG